jgi:hypothetical protein
MAKMLDAGAVTGPQVMRMRALGQDALAPAWAARWAWLGAFRAQDLGMQ